MRGGVRAARGAHGNSAQPGLGHVPPAPRSERPRAGLPRLAPYRQNPRSHATHYEPPAGAVGPLPPQGVPFLQGPAQAHARLHIALQPRVCSVRRAVHAHAARAGEPTHDTETVVRSWVLAATRVWTAERLQGLRYGFRRGNQEAAGADHNQRGIEERERGGACCGCFRARSRVLPCSRGSPAAETGA